LFYVEPTTATTVTLGTSIEGIYNPHQFEFDTTENRIYAFNSNPAVGQARMYEINLTTLAWVKVTLLTIQTSATGTFVCADKANKTLYVVGAVNAGGIAKIIYA
jgi:6-phosphogluconolactonase (cycloisomerase 2 family)